MPDICYNVTSTMLQYNVIYIYIYILYYAIIQPVSITRFPLIIFSTGAGLLIILLFIGSG